MAKKKETEEEVAEAEEVQRAQCGNPACGHLAATNPCEYCGFDNA